MCKSLTFVILNLSRLASHYEQEQKMTAENCRENAVSRYFSVPE